jgi:hypothetical protein
MPSDTGLRAAIEHLRERARWVSRFTLVALPRGRAEEGRPLIRQSPAGTDIALGALGLLQPLLTGRTASTREEGSI